LIIEDSKLLREIFEFTRGVGEGGAHAVTHELRVLYSPVGLVVHWCVLVLQEYLVGVGVGLNVGVGERVGLGDGAKQL
jgi:hypothetical protein